MWFPVCILFAAQQFIICVQCQTTNCKTNRNSTIRSERSTTLLFEATHKHTCRNCFCIVYIGFLVECNSNSGIGREREILKFGRKNWFVHKKEKCPFSEVSHSKKITHVRLEKLIICSWKKSRNSFSVCVCDSILAMMKQSLDTYYLLTSMERNNPIK